MENISALVWLYVKRRPFLKEVMRENVVNYSALARKISIEAFGDVKYENTVKMALIRLSKKIEKLESDLEGKILFILKNSSMVIKSKVAVVISSKSIDAIHPLSFAKSGRNITYILEQRELDNLPKKPSRCEENLNLITIESPPELEDVPGVISYILGALASEGINVVEFISCYTDTILVIKQADTEKAFRVLSSIME
ncbi:MAG: ACT domain-containing protein [Candidatus Micrarchaeota archaeon]|nr:ACT domain-containing protein [Candidatus Micrarchaeota archaeon]MBU1682084.1 ACT domain-containing protein [Candidatus Micrarchaeota archaeon]